MPPKFEAALQASLDAGAQISYRRNSQVARLGITPLTTGRGTVTTAGKRYQELAAERGLDTSLDPWNRGTLTRGQTEYATRRGGKEQAVGRWFNGILQPTAGAGEQHYGQYREEYILHIPVLRHQKERGPQGRWLPGSTVTHDTMPLHRFAIEGTGAQQETASAP